MRTFFRFLANHRLFTAINILGFALSLAFLLLLGDLVYRQTSIENFQTRGDRTFAFGNEEFTMSNFRLGQPLTDKFPEIEDWCAVGGYGYVLELNGEEIGTRILVARENFFEFFDYGLQVGDKSMVLKDIYSVVVSRTFADKYFNGQDVIGQQMVVGDDDMRLTYTITGIMDDIDRSVIPSDYECVVNIENLKYIHSSAYNENMGNAANLMLYFMEREGCDLRARCDDMAEYLKSFFWLYNMDVVKQVVLTPISDLYYDGKMAGFNGDSLEHGDRNIALLYVVIGLCVLVFAIFNYINLSVTLTTDRSKEMATRRLLGAQSGGIFVRLMSESIVFTSIAFIIGFLASLGLQDYASSLTNCHLDIVKDFAWWHYFVVILAICLVGIVAGIVPSSVLSNYKPIDIVRGTFRQIVRQRWSHVLMITQTVFTLVMLTTVMLLSVNIKERLAEPLGFNYENIMEVYGPLADMEQRYNVRDRLMSLAGVESVGMGYGTPLSFLENQTMSSADGDVVSMRWLMGDSAMFNMLGIYPLKTYEEDNYEQNYVSVNKRLLEILNKSDDARDFSLYNSVVNEIRYHVASVYDDVVYQNVLSADANPPMMMFRYNEITDSTSLVNMYGYPSVMYVKYNPTAIDEVEVSETIERIMLEVTGRNGCETRTLESVHKDWFEDYGRFLTVLEVFTVVAFIISILGLLAMNSYFISNRKREIAVRKVLGSTTSAVVVMLMRTVIIQFVVSLIVSLPLSTWLAPKVASLSGMSVDMKYAPFAMSAFVVVAVICLTVWIQSYRAANENPVNSIKTE